MTQGARQTGIDEADAEDRVFGPAITGFMHSFADPAVERRYQADIAPQAQRRLASLIWVAVFITLARMAAPTTGLVGDPSAGQLLVPRILQVLVCFGFLAALREPRRYVQTEWLSGSFAVFYLVTRCGMLPSMNTDGSVALLVGTIPLLYFGSPLRIGILAPILLTGSGAMLLAWTQGQPRPPGIDILQTLEWMAVLNLVGITAMRLMRYSMRRQWALSQALRHLATHDGLTGIANRRHFDQSIARTWQRCHQAGRDVSLILMDVDFFKLLNDGIGHAAGDDCLRDIAALLQDCVSGPDCLVARTGGEEFACILPDHGELAARATAERIMSHLRTQRMPHPGSPIGPHITVSLGVATARPEDGLTVHDLASLADRLMYSAKSDGRDRLRQQVLARRDAPALAAAQ
jgi:diguanylate cyclase (GGDEF)-like protein